MVISATFTDTGERVAFVNIAADGQVIYCTYVTSAGNVNCTRRCLSTGNTFSTIASGATITS